MAKSKEEQRIYRHEYYIANKDRELELHRIWKENNSDRFKELQKEYYENNKEYIWEYNKEYKKRFYEKYRRDTAYLLIDKSLAVLYCGSTSNVYKRINEKHIGGWSNLHLTKERWNELECSHFEYCYLDGLQNKQERLYIEKMLIEKFNSTLNQDEPIRDTSCITEDRKAELEEYADSLVFKIWNR